MFRCCRKCTLWFGFAYELCMMKGILLDEEEMKAENNRRVCFEDCQENAWAICVLKDDINVVYRLYASTLTEICLIFRFLGFFCD